ncbi:MAG: ATP-dependent nuclease [Mycoplasma sp.]
MAEINKVDTDKYLNSDRVVLVGSNSQGKSTILSSISKSSKVKDNCIFINSENKSDETISNSKDSSFLIKWLNELINFEEINEFMNEKIDNINKNLKGHKKLNVKLTNNLKTCKGIVEAQISTDSNDFNKTGSGENCLATLVLINDVLEDQNNSAVNKNQYKYLIIDEPESHLHPSLVVEMAKILKEISKKGIKVIVATHSNDFCQHFIEDTCEIFLVENGNATKSLSKIELFNLKDEINLYSNENLLFKSYKDLNNGNLLKTYFDDFIIPNIISSFFNKKVVLAEGQAESALLNLFPKYKLIFIENIIVNGKCWLPWYIICLKKLGIKVLSIFDKDNKKSDIKHEAYNEFIEKESDDYYSFIENIEEYLEIKNVDKSKFSPTSIYLKYYEGDKKIFNLLNEIFEKWENL